MPCSEQLFMISMCFSLLFQNVSLHDVGAVTGFISALIYCWLQTLMSYKLRDHGVINSTAICHSRSMLSAIMTCSFVVFIVLQFKSHSEWDHERPYTKTTRFEKLKWSPGDPGYVCHVISNIAEWSMTGAFFMFVSTFSTEFQKIRITSDISSTEYWQ